MIIVLEKADFSQNSIGQVDVRTELTPKQEAQLANFSKVLSQGQKWAFADLMNGLDENNLTPKIKHLYLPILAGQASEAFINLNSPSYKNDQPLDNSKWIINNGVKNKFKNKEEGAEAPNKADLSDIMQNNFHILFNVDGEEYIKTDSGNGAPVIFDSTVNYLFTIQINRDKRSAVLGGSKLCNGAMLGDILSKDPWGLLQKVPMPLMGFGIKDNECVVYNPVDESDMEAMITKNQEAINIPMKKDNWFNASSGYGIQATLRVLSLGDGLTREEHAIYQDLTKKFVDAVMKG